MGFEVLVIWELNHRIQGRLILATLEFGKTKVDKMVLLVPLEGLLKESGYGCLFHKAGKLGLRSLEEGEFFTAVFS